jgi:pimeloyl-ACP methyl ester carboxylesterase
MVTILLRPDRHSVLPSQGRIHELKVPILFLFGKYDWCESTHYYQLKESDSLKKGSDIKYVENAGHGLQFKNTEQSSMFIREFVFAR